MPQVPLQPGDMGDVTISTQTKKAARLFMSALLAFAASTEKQSARAAAVTPPPLRAEQPLRGSR